MVNHLWRNASLATVLMLSLTAIPAAAVTCSGSGCNGQDPVSTGCVDDAVWATYSALLDGSSVVIGYVHLMWSPTCETVWSRVSTYDSYDAQADNLTHQAWLSNGQLNFSSVSTSDLPPTPSNPSDYDDYDEVFDPALDRHLEGTMRHRSHAWVSNGVKACGKIYGLVATTCTGLRYF